MTLPTIQPVDGPDWSTIPSFTTQTFNFAAVASTGDILLEQTLGYYAYAVLVLSGDGDGEDYAVTIDILDAPSGEGGSIIFSQVTVRTFGVPTVVPMSVIGQSIRLRDAGATAYPHNVIGSLTLYSAYPFQTGFPGGIWVINEQQTTFAGGTSLFAPLGCAPGPHAVSVTTASVSWNLDLRVWTDAATTVDYAISAGVSGNLVALPFNPPASAWEMVFTNNDIANQPVAVLAVRNP